MSANADNYRPVFLQNVHTTMPNGAQTVVNPVYCLAEESAEQLREILSDLDPVIFLSTPYKMQQGGGGVTVSHQVPWFRMPSGCEINCGTEANYWVNAPSGSVAEQNCRKDIAAAEDQYAKEGGGQQP